MTRSPVSMDGLRRFDYGWVIVGVSFLTLALSYGVWYSSSVLFVALLREFGWSRSVISGGFSIFFVLHHLIGPGIGGMVDRIGPRRVIFLGSLLAFIGLLLSTLTQTQWQFYLFFGVITAAGLAGTGWVTNTTIIHHWFREKQGFPIGVVSAGIGVGILICVPLTQHLVDLFGWRIAYRVIAVAAPCMVALMALLFLKKPCNVVLPSSPERPWPGRVSNPAVPDGTRIPPEPWTVRRALRTKSFWLLAFASFLGTLTMQAILPHQVAFFVDHGMEALFASTVVGMVGIGSVGGKVLIGLLSDRIGREKAYLVGSFWGIVGTASLIVFEYHPLVPLCYLYAFAFALGYAANSALPPIITGDLFGGKAYGSIFGTLTIANGLGGASGAWLSGVIFDRWESYVPAFVIVIACFLIACLLIWKAAPRRVQRVRDEAQGGTRG